LSNRDIPLLIVAGLVATIVGSLLLGPLAIRTFSRLAGRVPIAPRLALRDLARYQARSGAALAAVTLALGIAVTVVVITSAEDAKRAAEPPALSNRAIRVNLGPADAKELPPADATARFGRVTSSVRKLAALLDGATVTPLRKVVQPNVSPMVFGHDRLLPTLELTRRFDNPKGRKSYRVQSELYVATPAVLRYLGIDPGTIRSGTDFLVDRGVDPTQLVIPDMTKRGEFAVTKVQKIDVGDHRFGDGGGYPANFITVNGLRRHGWKQPPIGWLVESSRPLTSDQIASARDIAARAGLAIEFRRENRSRDTVMAIATGAGALFALGILALTVGLIRSESGRDLRILTATGATARIRRKLTAATAGALALLGALLGVVGAYLVLTATYYDDLAYLSHPPVVFLALAVVGVPLAAAAAGWLVAGREPPAIARAAIE